MKPKKVLSVIMALLMALSLLPSLVFAAAEPAGELGGRLKIKGKAAVGCELRADYEKVTPGGLTDEYVTFLWSRKTVEGEAEVLTEVGTESVYTLMPEDLGAKLVLKITGAADLGVTGELQANTVEIAATEEEAPEETTEKTEEEKAAEGFVEIPEVPEEAPQEHTEEILGEEPVYEELPEESGESLEIPENTEIPENPEDLENVQVLGETQGDQPSEAAPEKSEGIVTDDSLLDIGTTEVLNVPEGEETKSVSYSAQIFMEQDGSVLDFGTLQAGFSQEPERKTVTVKNTGTGTLNFEGLAPEHFMVQDITEPLAGGESVTLWVQPRVGTAEGTYLDTITYTAEEGVSVSFDAALIVAAPLPEDEAPRKEEGEEANIEPEKEQEDAQKTQEDGTDEPKSLEAQEEAQETEKAGDVSVQPMETPEALDTDVKNAEVQTAEPQDPVPPVFQIKADQTALDFGSAVEGYGDVAEKAITLKNEGAADTAVGISCDPGTMLQVVLPEGMDPANVLIPANGTLTLQAKPKTGLTANTYRETIHVKDISGAAAEGESLSEITITADFAVAAATRNVTSSVNALDFGTVETGYAEVAAKDVVLSNSGNTDARIAVQANEAFDIRNESGAAVTEALVPANNVPLVLKVQPKAGLGAASYSDKPIVLVVDGAVEPLTIATSFTVKAPDTFGIVLNLSGKDFGTVEEGYQKLPGAETVTVTNTGNTTITLNQPAGKNFEVGALSTAELAPNASASFTVQPRMGLKESIYEEDILVSTEKSQATLKVVFTVVEGSAKLTGIKKPSDITGLANGTKKTADDLGLPSKVTISTTDGKMKAKVKWDVKGSAYEPGSAEGQTFSVKGSVTLPDSVKNPDKISRIISVKVSVNGRAAVVADPAGNTIGGISSSQAYTTETKITITANGAGMDNTAPGTGDIRYLPANWKVLETRIWETAPYTATFRMGKGGTYTLSVTFNQQRFDGNSWVNTGSQDMKQVGFTVTEATPQNLTPTADRTDAATKTAVQTGDATPIMTFVIILIVAVVLIIGIVVYRKKRK